MKGDTVRKEYTGWAVEWKSTAMPWEPAFLVGRYWFQDGDAPASREGHKIALFETMAAAREAAKARTYGRYRVYKVSVKISRVRK